MLGGLNTYAYANGNSVKYSDSSGLCVGPLIAACAVVVENLVAINTAGIVVAELGAGASLAGGAAVFTGRVAQPLVYDVYYGIKNGVPAYVGITKNIVQRQQQWSGEYDRLEKVTSCSVTKDQARGIEQYLINMNPNFNNKINSISPNRSWYDEAINYGEVYMEGLIQK